MNRPILLIALALLVSWTPVFAQVPAAEQTPEQGRLEARKDIKDGKFIIKAWGLSSIQINGIPSSEDVYQEILARKYKIRYEKVAECLIPEDTLSYANAYNEVSYAAIKAKYGPDIFEKVRKEADAEYLEKYEPKAREFEQNFKAALEMLKKKNN
jgi:hypothetical protein